MIRRLLATVLFVPLAVTAVPSSTERLAVDDVAAATRSPPLRAAIARARAALARGDLGAVAQALEPARHLDALAFEAQADALLESLLAGAPIAALRPAVEALTNYRPRVRLQHPETAAAHYRVAYPVDQRARDVLRSWDADASALALEELLRNGATADFARALVAADPLAAQRFVARAAHRDVRLLAVAAKAAAVDAPEGYWLALTRVAADASIYAQALARAPDRERLVMLAELTARLPARAATPLLEAHVRDPALGSAAIGELGRLHARTGDPALRARLLDHLADPVLGESAAAALARAPSPAIREAVAARLAAESDPVRQRHGLLYLRLDGSPEAIAAARAFAASAHAAPALVDEVAQW